MYLVNMRMLEMHSNGSPSWSDLPLQLGFRDSLLAWPQRTSLTPQLQNPELQCFHQGHCNSRT